MNEPAMNAQTPNTADTAESGDGLSPLPGEAGIPNVAAARKPSVDKKGLLALACVIITLLAFGWATILNFFKEDPPADPMPKLAADRPSAAAGETRKLDFAQTPASQPQRIPALIPTAEERADPIGVRRTDQGSPAAGSTAGANLGPKPVSPEDAPVMLLSSRAQENRAKDSAVLGQTQPTDKDAATDAQEGADDPLQATKRNLQAYQLQLQEMLEALTRSSALATGQVIPPEAGLGRLPSAESLTPANHAGPSMGLFGGQLQGSATPPVLASQMGNRSLILPKGTAFTCALKTRIISAASGLVGCQVQRHVFSEDGRVLLLERGSHIDGEYRIVSMRPGMVRIPVLWTRIRTPLGVIVDIESPGTGQLGESGVDGYVDKRWGERIGAAMLMSLIDDSVKLVIQSRTQQIGLDGSSTVILPSTTANTSKLAEKVLDSTINIPPLIYQNQGGIVGIYVARDVDFSSVYELKAVLP
ncbi:type IV secretion system protein VirB10 [Paucibacter sp. KBW04]|uniref:type IV secretion system protein VirB10 n=1 Tax=Paucibacter sp. KBW04 TaxID=2153361 RepID=UPI000F55E710|nr:type IV secretion system protein VirB10 [Paucibacter sp. KBW04]RQO53242.1 type IV secretion system protein VirB10 [Paucibacter sp. KBW04]